MAEELNTRAFAAFNTQNTVSAACSDADLDAVQRECERFERLFSHTMPESSLVRLNNAGGRPLDVEPELAGLIQRSFGYCEATEGLFDITIGPLVALWDFHEGRVPDAEALAQACAHVGWQRVHVDGNAVCIEDPQGALALGGIAKGYIADALVRLLQQRGVERGIINLGGNAVVFGGKPDGSPYNVGIRTPRATREEEPPAFAVVQLASGSVVTSGVYERCFNGADGTLYHHILDPRTGMPAQTDLVSATLVSQRSLDGDGYTTALILMGLERALSFAEGLPGCEAVLVGRDGAVHTTSGIGSAVPFAML